MKFDQLVDFNALAFVLKNNILNENQTALEFDSHRFLRKPYTDEAEQQRIKKASQVGWSTLAIVRSLHIANYREANIVYTMPSRNAVKDFVMPKVDPILEANPVLKSWIGETDRVELKKVGKRFIYFRGSWEPSSAISISAHIVINDEVDRSNPKTLRTYKTRLDHAKQERPDLGFQWEFSNPSIPGAGVDEGYDLSDQKHWMIKCPHCNEWQFLSFPENIDFIKECYICSVCKKELTNDDRKNGQWVKKWRDRIISGYWISQLMVPWIPASKIIKESYGDQEVFHNFTLGLAYISKDLVINRQTITKCISPDVNPRNDVSIGVDNGVVKHYVVGNRFGIFKVGKTESWEEIEDLRNRYAATMIIDALPYPNTPTKFAKLYPGKVFIHYYVQDKKQVGIVRWGEGDKRGTVESDRTKIFDAVVANLNNQEITFNLTITDLEDYINHWQSLYRTIKETIRGIKVPTWETIESKPDHYAHATVLWKIGLEKTLIHGGIVRPAQVPPAKQIETHPIVSPDLKVPGIDLGKIARQSTRQIKDWRTQ